MSWLSIAKYLYCAFSLAHDHCQPKEEHGYMITHSGETPHRCKLENEQRRLQIGHVLLLHSVSFQGNCFLKGRKRRGSQSCIKELDCKLPPRCPCYSCPIAVTTRALTVPRTDQCERKLRTKHAPVQCSTWWYIKNTHTKKKPKTFFLREADGHPTSGEASENAGFVLFQSKHCPNKMCCTAPSSGEKSSPCKKAQRRFLKH